MIKVHRAPLVCLVALLFVAACKDGNPVAPPTGTQGPGPDSYTVTVTASRSQVEAKSTGAVTLTVVALRSDGSNAPDGTQVTLNTSLGSFGSDATGKPVQLTTAILSGGRATAQFFAGDTTGIANILASIGTNVGQLNLPIVAAPPVPVADFTFTTANLSVIFTDTSTGSPTSWRWQFGDGNESTDRNPRYSYAAAGSYTVTLTVRNNSGENSKSQFVTVTLGSPPVAAFEFTISGQQVNFVDKSTGGPTSWAWTFGDGTSSNQRNPIHIYPAPGTYTVTLTATNAAGSNATSNVVTITSGTPPTAAFDATVTGRQVNFVDKSTGDPTSWSWDFGDGGTSTSRNPIYTYAAAGTYTVTLTVGNAAGTNSTSKAVKIEPGTPPVAVFQYSTTNRQVNFIDKSTGNPTSWNWNFGDGTSSTQQNPVHLYGAAGNYTVTLTVSNADGSNSTSQIVTIAAAQAPVANFEFTTANLQVNFLDKTTNSPTAWSWSFGDGFVSFLQNPVHTYAAAGTYTVTLTATNDSGSSNVSKVVTVTAPSPPNR